MSKVEAKLAEHSLELPHVPEMSVGMIERAKQIGDLVFVSGHGPQKSDGNWAFVGRVGEDVTLEEAKHAAKLCVLNCLAAVRTLIGSLDEIQEIVRVRGFVNSAPGFCDQPKVMDGASELLLELFGEAGKHVRTAIGTSVLPHNIPVEVDMVVKVKTMNTTRD